MTEERLLDICAMLDELKHEAERVMREYCEIHGIKYVAYLEFTRIDDYGDLVFTGEEHCRGSTEHYRLDLPGRYLHDGRWPEEEREKVRQQRELADRQRKEHDERERQRRLSQYEALRREFESTTSVMTEDTP